MGVMTPWIVACQAPPLMEFFRQEYWSDLTFPTPGDLSNPGIKNAIPELAGRFFTTKPPGLTCGLHGLHVLFYVKKKIKRIKREVIDREKMFAKDKSDVPCLVV